MSETDVGEQRQRVRGRCEHGPHVREHREIHFFVCGMRTLGSGDLKALGWEWVVLYVPAGVLDSVVWVVKVSL
jgi:hypothetical protein